MNENMVPATSEASVMTSVPQSSNTNDIIDLTEIGDECEVSTSCSVIVPNNSVNLQQPGCRPARNRTRSSNCSEDNPYLKQYSESADDSICILYENVQPPPDVVFVNEVVIDGSGENESADNDLFSPTIPPIIMGEYTEHQVMDYQEIPPLFPDISSENISSFSLPFNHSYDVQHSSLPSCKYATRQGITHPPISNVATSPVAFQRLPGPSTKVPLSSLPDNIPSQNLESEKPNIGVKAPKIQCGICLDGPEEIAASDRNFTSTNCGHIFCNICIKTSMKSAAKCPKCRKRITSRQIHPLYL